MIKFYNETEEEPKYYSISDCGNFSYAKESDYLSWSQYLIENSIPEIKGELKDLDKEYQIIDWKRKEGNQK